MKLLIALAALAATTVGAEETYLRRQPLNGTAASLTFTISNGDGKYSYANIEVSRTRVAGTDLTLTCKSTTRKSTTPTAVRTKCDYDASGVCTSVTATLKSATSATEVLAWRVSVAGWERTDCTFASTAAGATDLVSATGRLVAEVCE